MKQKKKKHVGRWILATVFLYLSVITLLYMNNNKGTKYMWPLIVLFIANSVVWSPLLLNISTKIKAGIIAGVSVIAAITMCCSAPVPVNKVMLGIVELIVFAIKVSYTISVLIPLAALGLLIFFGGAPDTSNYGNNNKQPSRPERDENPNDENLYACKDTYRSLHPYSYNPATGGANKEEDEKN